MANIENINVGLAANDKKGDPLRDAMQKVNRNFSALNTAIQGVLDGKGQASGYASLGADGRLLAAQTPIMYAPTLPTTTHDLNNYFTPGSFYQAAVAGSTAPTGVNYPVAQVGFLEVVATGTPVLQVYTTRAAVSQQYWRVRNSSSSWSAWAEVLRGSLLASAGGVATLGADSRLLPAQAPVVFTASLNAVDANTIVTPGVYSNNADASATAALNWPEQLAGTLTVEASTASNAQVTQTYTTRNGTGGVTRTYKRVRFGGSGGTWGLWQQLARFDDAMTHVYLGAAGVDCNTLIADNTYYTIDQAGAVTSGSNWPPTSSIIGGSVEVRRQAATRVFQTVTLLVGSNMKPRIFFRYGDPVGNSWQSWTMISSLSSVGWLPTANCGDVYVDGVGWHRWNGTAYEMSALAPWLPTAAHDLNNYTTPGEFCQSSTAGATVGTNYPVAIGGFLKVTQGAGINGTVQEYTVRSAGALAAASGPRKFWRVRDGSSWSPWQEVLSAGLGMTRAFLTAATDANTLIADNTFYTWTASAVAGGANFPGYAAAGYMQVFWHAATIISQELTLLATGGKPLKFARFGNTSTGVWQPWKVTSAFNSTSWMPTSNMGDIYVDGLGWHSWNGTSYKLTLAGRDHGQCRFDYVNAVSCRLSPYDGNGLIINGRQYRIPAAGVIVSSNQLTAQTLHYIYAYDDGTGAIALEASTSTFATHTDGVTIKSGDPSRTLVGMAITPASGTFVYNNTLRYVSSYFNRKLMTIIEYVSASTASFNNPVALNNGCGCLVWGGSVQLHATGQVNSGNGSVGAYLSLRVNGTAALGGWGYSCIGSGLQIPYAMVGPWYAATGLITLQTYGYGNVSGATVNIVQDQGITYEG
ncbi:pyocin knob domain-containing protein [Achromobacter kerstersii]|uniref:pyocin knob domain-containing protein n=1 Tax=Achromobacter kerstersii TaxID=1353890 RepID=UPI003207E216